MKDPTIEALTNALIFAGLPKAEAIAHAGRILDDLARFPIEGFRLENPVRVSEAESIIEYSFGKTAYSIDNARPENSPVFQHSDHGGTQLDRENLLYFLRVSEIARSVVPELWLKPDTDLIGQVTSPRQHLDALNEFWWLSRWRKPSRIDRAQQTNPVCKKDVDWQLTWEMGFGSPLIVNLEIKRRTGADVLRLAQDAALKPTELFAAGLEDKKGNSKFRPSRDNEINVLGLTLLGEIDHDVQDAAHLWIQTRSDIDAVLLFSRFSVHRSGFDPHILRKRGILDQVLIRELDALDLRLHSLIARPLPFTDGQLQFLP